MATFQVRVKYVLCVKDVIPAWLKCSWKPVPFAFQIQARLIIHKNMCTYHNNKRAHQFVNLDSGNYNMLLISLRMEDYKTQEHPNAYSAKSLIFLHHFF